MNRRDFLKSSLACAGGVLVASNAPAQTVPSSSARKLVLSAPLTHSDWMLKPNMKWGPEGVKHMLDACKACGWSRVHWRVFDAGRSTYKSKLLAPGSTPEENSFYSPKGDEDQALFRKYAPSMTPGRIAEIQAGFLKMDYSNFDSLACAIEYGHRIGLKIDAWASINEDDHGWGWRSEFAKAHPEYRWVRKDGKPYRSQMSFSFPQVREYKLALIKELLGYEIDGLFLDWIRTGDVRDNPQTDPDGVANSGYEAPNIEAFKNKYQQDPHEVANGDERWVRTRAEPQTLFMREMRKLVKAERKDLPMTVMVGHPWHYRGLLDKIDGNLRGLLLDVKTWADEKMMDSAVAAGYYRDGGNAELAYDALRKETGSAVDVWTYAWVPQNAAEATSTLAIADKVGAGNVLFWEADYIDDRANAAEIQKALRARAKDI
jgi:hypothetical protein